MDFVVPQTFAMQYVHFPIWEFYQSATMSAIAIPALCYEFLAFWRLCINCNCSCKILLSGCVYFRISTAAWLA